MCCLSDPRLVVNAQWARGQWLVAGRQESNGALVNLHPIWNWTTSQSVGLVADVV